MKYPDITVQLIGEDGNAIAIVQRVTRALRRGGVPAEEVTEFRRQALSGDYDHVLNTCMEWVDAE